MIIIAGAGPVGLTAALCLKQQGVPFIVFEKRPHPNRASRASTFLPAVLPFFERLGLLPRMLQRGLKVSRLKFFDLDEGRDVTLDLGKLQTLCDHPFRLHLEQHHLCDMIVEELSDEVNFETEIFQVANDENCCSVECSVGRSYRGDWLLAADGANSTVRTNLGLSFDGYDFPSPVLRLFFRELPFALAERLEGVNYFRRGEQTLSILKMRSTWRVIVRVFDKPEEELLNPQWQLDYLNSFFGFDLWLSPATRCDLYRVGQRLACSNRLGRTMLLGDACHITNTRGGMNMNVGLVDAVRTADALARWWHEKGRVESLDDVVSERLTFARDKLLKRTEQLARRSYLGEQDIFQIAKSPQQELAYLRKVAMLDEPD